MLFFVKEAIFTFFRLETYSEEIHFDSLEALIQIWENNTKSDYSQWYNYNMPRYTRPLERQLLFTHSTFWCKPPSRFFFLQVPTDFVWFITLQKPHDQDPNVHHHYAHFCIQRPSLLAPFLPICFERQRARSETPQQETIEELVECHYTQWININQRIKRP